MDDQAAKIQADRRANFLDQLKNSKAINMDAPLSSVLETTSELPGGTTSLTVLYDDKKWYAIMP
jgi:hypothetical protein